MLIKYQDNVRKLFQYQKILKIKSVKLFNDIGEFKEN